MVHTFPSNRIDVTLIVIHGVDENIAYFILRLTLKNQIQITLEKKNDAMHCTKLYIVRILLHRNFLGYLNEQINMIKIGKSKGRQTTLTSLTFLARMANEKLFSVFNI